MVLNIPQDLIGEVRITAEASQLIEATFGKEVGASADNTSSSFFSLTSLGEASKLLEVMIWSTFLGCLDIVLVVNCTFYYS